MNVPVLVIDDDESITTTLAVFLKSKGYSVTVVNDGADALERVRTGGYPVIVSDIYIDRVSGLDVLKQARRANPEAAVILMTARGSMRTTVEAETGGAFEYLAKPFEMRDLLATIERAQAHALSLQPERPAEDIEQFGNMVGFSPAMVAVYRNIARSAASEETVLIVGETGVGKELVARALHEHSARAQKPFVPVDSGAVPGALWESEIFGAVRGAFTGADRDRPGVVETAKGGTVFFDEIGEVPLEFQAKLLRFLQNKEYRPVGSGSPRLADVRVVAATNRALEVMVREGKFREDLFYRLNVLRIDVPPLRERRSDIPFLVQRFLSKACVRAKKRIWLDADALDLLSQDSWPGNVRQLENCVHRLVALSSPGPVSARAVAAVLDVRDRAAPAGESDGLDELERRQIRRVLDQTGGNKTRAAAILGIQRRTLYKKLARMEQGESGGRRDSSS